VCRWPGRKWRTCCRCWNCAASGVFISGQVSARVSYRLSSLERVFSALLEAEFVGTSKLGCPNALDGCSRRADQLSEPRPGARKLGAQGRQKLGKLSWVELAANLRVAQLDCDKIIGRALNSSCKLMTTLDSLRAVKLAAYKCQWGRLKWSELNWIGFACFALVSRDKQLRV